MSYTPFEREMLKLQQRTNELLELLEQVMARQLVGYQINDMHVAKAEELAKQTQAGRVPIEQALAAAGILPMRAPGRPPTPEQRAERFAARAREVGLSEEKAAEVSGRVQLNLDNLRDGAAPDAEVPAEQKTPRKRTPRATG